MCVLHEQVLYHSVHTYIWRSCEVSESSQLSLLPSLLDDLAKAEHALGHVVLSGRISRLYATLFSTYQVISMRIRYDRIMMRLSWRVRNLP